jgi:hypothetical protein
MAAVRSRFILRPRDWWQYAALILAFLQISFALIPRLHPGKVGMFCWYLGSDPIIWWFLTSVIFLGAITWSIRRRPFWSGWRFAGYGLLAALAASPLTYRVYPSSHDHSPSLIRFRLPLDGPITVGWGGGTPDVNYHVIAPDQRWAYDLLVTVDGATHSGDGRRWENYYIYARPVLAPAAGRVYGVFDRDPDMPIGQLGGGRVPCGNHVVLEVAPSQFVFLCHLKPRSVVVKAGDTVVPGQVLARAGNSGNTSEPHVHIHLQDSPEMGISEGIPLYFHGYRTNGQFVERGMPHGGFAAGKLIGEIVENAGNLPGK